MRQSRTVFTVATAALILAACGGEGIDGTTEGIARDSTAPAPSTSPGDVAAGSAKRLTAHPTGETGAPLGYYEYLPPGYGDGDLRPLLVFVHGRDESGDGSLGQLDNLFRDGGAIPALIQNNDGRMTARSSCSPHSMISRARMSTTPRANRSSTGLYACSNCSIGWATQWTALSV